ncbi:MAG: hypothetical protein IPN29_05810 [Saprospiraceae bacterium]|nr:hypothetical protein [Saprospiraceae bacterium]
MKGYIKRILNNCREVSYQSMMGEEAGLSLKAHVEMKIHLTFCKYCRHFAAQSKIIDSSLKLYKAQSESDPPYKASETLKQKLRDLIS